MHDCVNCGCACYCHGDIDDCPVETIEYAYEHCTGCGCPEELEDIDDYDGLCSHGALEGQCSTCAELQHAMDLELGDADVCQGCGSYRAWAHSGVKAWDQAKQGGIAPQLCSKCWKERGHPWPAETT